jgi:hypothetical protein
MSYTPNVKDNADRLVRQITNIIWDSGNTVSKPLVKHIVSKIIFEILGVCTDADTIKYWQETKEELHKI